MVIGQANIMIRIELSLFAFSVTETGQTTAANPCSGEMNAGAMSVMATRLVNQKQLDQFLDCGIFKHHHTMRHNKNDSLQIRLTLAVHRYT